MIHKHTDECRVPCDRQEDIDPRSVTGLHKLVKVAKRRAKEGRPPRKEDRSLMWWFGYHAIKALWQLAGLVALYWVAKQLGIAVPT